MFYYLSKILWGIFNPYALASILTILLCFLCFTPWRRIRKYLAGFMLACIFVIMIFPAGTYLNYTISTRFPQQPPLPNSIDGIVVLGGAIDPDMTIDTGHYVVGGSFDRVLAFADLARDYPEARLVYSGGSHAWEGEIGEAAVMTPLLEQLGISADRLVLEDKSRNTSQNAVMSFNLVKPAAEEKWVLVTSSYHMPRAIGAFRQAGWPDTLIAYPVDPMFPEDAEFKLFTFNFWRELGNLSKGLHEMMGLIAYRLSDRSSDWIPGPAQ